MRELLKFYFILLPIVFGVAPQAFGQSFKVSGKCTDRRGKPIEEVLVYSEEADPSTVNTDKKGKFELTFNKPGTVLIRFKSFGEQVKRTVVLTGKNQKLDEVKFGFQLEEGGSVSVKVDDPFDIPELKKVDWQKIPMGSVERYLIYTTAATSNNELTTNYNVRGGSYEENLVYVNGFNVYRPFLTRSGQQEGLSFVNSALVESLRFSAGGFDTRYGDKLSSVLDITYKQPDSLRGSLVASLLGAEAHIEQGVTPRFNYLVGARYSSNGYLLNALPTKGAYNPVFWDAQVLTNFALTEKLTWSVLGHFSSNNYRFTPQTSRTQFGTANEAYSFNIYFDGQEQTVFQTMMGGTSLKWNATKKTNLELYTTVFNSNEREYFDIQGQYFLNQLETDPNKEEFGDSIASLGVGSFLNHARNRLIATIFNVYHHGDHSFFKGYKDDERTQFQSHALKWGVNFQMDDFTDRLSEWRVIDSAGFSLPQSTGELQLYETIKGRASLQSQRYTSFLQFNSIWKNNQKNKIVTLTKKYKDKKTKKKYEETYQDTIRGSSSRWTLSVGTRAGYTTANQELYVTPRASVTYSPRAYMVKDGKIVRRNVNIRFATGLYYQPPFYREFRTFKGDLNLNVKAQKSAHFVAGADVYFSMWGREVPFKFSGEAFYKYLWDVNPYEIENVRTRYYAHNNAKAYATGLDLSINGQFVKGIESFFKVGILQTKEDLLDDSYWEFYNQAGETIVFGISEDQKVVDSAQINPGYIPRPTDQLFTFGALIQDRMPKYESFSVQVGIQYGTGLPYGPPGIDRYKDTLRLKSYFRVDIGMSYDFLYKKKEKKNFFSKNFTDAVLSFEVFNLLGVNNVLSNQWIQDVNGRQYAVPNLLTQRRFNLKLILRY